MDKLISVQVTFRGDPVNSAKWAFAIEDAMKGQGVQLESFLMQSHSEEND